MVFSKKICLYTTFLGSIFCFNLRAEDVSTESVKPLEKVASAIQNEWHINLLTRVVAKTAIEATADAVKTANPLYAAKEIGKEIGNTALNEVAPLAKDADFFVKHADLVLPILIVKALPLDANLKNADKSDKTKEARVKETVIALLKKELGKGFFVNPDFKNLETLNDAAFFAADFGAEVVLNDDDINQNLKNGLRRAISSKIITPLLMEKAGNDFAHAFIKTENKNIQKAICNLFEKLVVSKIVDAALQVQK